METINDVSKKLFSLKTAFPNFNQASTTCAYNYSKNSFLKAIFYSIEIYKKRILVSNVRTASK